MIETGSDHGMIDMNRTLSDLVRRGEITPENAVLNSFRPQVLQKMI
jgi:Tfp pilus assembly pilus retraction ATPase PilT